MKKISQVENPLQQPPLEHFQPIEEDGGEDDLIEKDDEEAPLEQIPPLRHPYPPFWEDHDGV